MISLNIAGRMDDCDELHVSCHARIKRGGGGWGSGPPLKNHRNIGLFSNACRDPIKPSQHSMMGCHWHARETPFKWHFNGGPMMAAFLVVF